VLSPDGELPRVQSAIELALSLIVPQALVQARFRFQWLAPLTDLDYARARVVAAEGFFDKAIPKLTDFAMIGDLRSDKPAGNVRVEAGVLQRAEIPMRLAGQGSGIAPPDPETPPTLWPVDSLPEVAFYTQSVWFVEGSLGGAEELSTVWGEALAGSGRLMSSLIAKARMTGKEDSRDE